MITRNFNLFLSAGRSVPLVINANQAEEGEQWVFSLFQEDGTPYTPTDGSIVGIKSDGYLISNSGTVVDGKVVINETQQMTAAAGKAVFELRIDGLTHGTANFIVLVEEDPTNEGIVSDSDLSLIEEALSAVSPLPTGGSVGQVLTKTASGSAWTDAGTPTQEQVADAVSDWADEHITVETGVVIDTSLAVAGAAADSKKVGDEITDLKSAIQTGGGFNAEVKSALDQFTASVLQLAEKVAYIDGNGQDYYDDIEDAADALHSSMNPPVNLSSISAVYTQSGTVYNTDTLDSLRTDLVVTAHYSDNTTAVVTNYTLSGTLAVGTSTITVTYGGKTTTFNVTVTDGSEWGTDYTWLYKAVDGVLLSARTDLVTPQIGTGCTETLVDDLLHITVPENSTSLIRYSLFQTTNTNAKLTAKVKFGSIPYAQAGNGLRLQVSNGTNGAQIFEHYDRGSNWHFGTFEGNTYKNQIALDLNTWYIISVERNNGNQIVTVDGTEILNSSTLSTNYCTANAIIAQSALNSPTGLVGDIEWVTYKNND